MEYKDVRKNDSIPWVKQSPHIFNIPVDNVLDTNIKRMGELGELGDI